MIQTKEKIKCDLNDKTCYSQVLKCDSCHKTFKYENDFQEHKKFHEKENKSKCDYCGKIVGKIDAHIKAVHEGLKIDYGCDKCEKKFSNKATLTKHEEKIHLKVNNGFKCYFCEKNLSSKPNLNHHIKNFHLDENEFKCEKCDKCFTEKYRLKRHVTLLHEPYSEKLMTKCDICNMTVKKNSLWTHMENHGEKSRSANNVENSKVLINEPVRNDVKMLNQCKICHKVVTHLRIHIKTQHEQCKKCSSSFTKVDELKKHQKYCKINLQCKYCKKKFNCARSLKGHIKIFHEEDKMKIFKCDDCDKTFNSHHNLCRHHLTVHQKIKSHKCETCGMHFGTKHEVERQQHICS